MLITILVLPILDDMHYWVGFVDTGSSPMSFATYWVLSMKIITKFHVGWMEMTSYHRMTDYFYQRYVWFLSLLLLFFIVFTVLFEIRKHWRYNIKHMEPSNTVSSRSNLRTFLTTGGLTILLFGAVKLFVYPEFLSTGWFSLGNLFQFQLGKMLIYAVYFGLGIYAYLNQWFSGELKIGHTYVWGLLCIILFGINMMILKFLEENGPHLLTLKIVHVILYPTWILSFLGFLLTFSYRYWNRVTPLNRTLGANSYDMYLSHYMFPMSLPLLLRNWGVTPTVVKFGIVAIATVLFSYFISRFLIKPFPKLTAIGIIAFSVILGILT